MKQRDILIIDNGSKRAAAVLQLRDVARRLSHKCGFPVNAVSLQHSNSIAVDQLNGQPAQILSDYLQQRLQQGINQFSALPLFFGKSRALTSFVPDVLESVKEEYPLTDFEMAEVVYPLPDGEPLMVDIIKDHILSLADQHALKHQSVVLVDHGSPSPSVTAVRNHVAEKVSESLHGYGIDEAVMERREGPEYDFNGPLLEHYLDQQAEKGVKRVIVAMMFFLPGRHAGTGGDVNDICSDAMQRHPALDVRISPLIAEHELIVEILYQRMQSMGLIQV